ncbi:leucine-rich protein [Aphelenchoides avenae]|nr:leucine-rich protein [Aphelenchus avenae]
MDLDNSNLAKELECPVCLDVFDEPKLLLCGHTIRAAANARAGRDENSVKCPECSKETEIPPEGLATNYRLVGLVCRVQKPLVDACACNDCGKRALVDDMFTCETCQEALNCKPQQIQDACKGIADSGSLADMYVGLAMSHLNGSLKKKELISQLLSQRRRRFAAIEGRAKRADYNLTQEDLAASLQAANDLKQNFEQASSIANEAGKSLESILRDCLDKLEELFPEEDREEPVEAEDNGPSRNNFDLGEFDDRQKKIALNQCRVDAIRSVESLRLRNKLLVSINDNIVHATLMELDLSGNRITEIRGLDALVNLEVSNVSFNRLKKVEGLTNLAKLKRVHLEKNTIEKIEGLDALVHLELLDLDDNQIKLIENLGNQHNLRDLFLCSNKIRRIQNISHLSKLHLLSISGNLITKLENLNALVNLEELHVAKQGIETFDGIQNLNMLKVIDADKSSIASLDYLDHLQQLEELFVDKLARLVRLETVYLEGNPIQTQDRDNYRRKVVQALPQVTEVDARPCR